MMKIFAWVGLGLICGIAIYWGIGTLSDNNSISTTATTKSSVPSKDLELRLAMLETQLAEEVEIRQQLEDTLDNLVLNQWSGEPVDRGERPLVNRNLENAEDLTPEQRREQFFERQQERQATRVQRRTERLENAGFSSEQAAWILQREEELRLEELNKQWEQRRQRFLENSEGSLADNALREELGEAEYERYLEATGRPTRVYVSQLVENSTAKAAGFQPGDEIVRYDGKRVYNFNDLNVANVQGELGEPIIIDVIRDGTPMQLVVDRGPLGIVGGRQRGFRGR